MGAVTNLDQIKKQVQKQMDEWYKNTSVAEKLSMTEEKVVNKILELTHTATIEAIINKIETIGCTHSGTCPTCGFGLSELEQLKSGKLGSYDGVHSCTSPLSNPQTSKHDGCGRTCGCKQTFKDECWMNKKGFEGVPCYCKECSESMGLHNPFELLKEAKAQLAQKDTDVSNLEHKREELEDALQKAVDVIKSKDAEIIELKKTREDLGNQIVAMNNEMLKDDAEIAGWIETHEHNLVEISKRDLEIARLKTFEEDANWCWQNCPNEIIQRVDEALTQQRQDFEKLVDNIQYKDGYQFVVDEIKRNLKMELKK